MSIEALEARTLLTGMEASPFELNLSDLATPADRPDAVPALYVIESLSGPEDTDTFRISKSAFDAFVGDPDSDDATAYLRVTLDDVTPGLPLQFTLEDGQDNELTINPSMPAFDPDSNPFTLPMTVFRPTRDTFIVVRSMARRDPQPGSMSGDDEDTVGTVSGQYLLTIELVTDDETNAGGGTVSASGSQNTQPVPRDEVIDLSRSRREVRTTGEINFTGDNDSFRLVVDPSAFSNDAAAPDPTVQILMRAADGSRLDSGFKLEFPAGQTAPAGVPLPTVTGSPVLAKQLDAEGTFRVPRELAGVELQITVEGQNLTTGAYTLEAALLGVDTGPEEAPLTLVDGAAIVTGDMDFPGDGDLYLFTAAMNGIVTVGFAGDPDLPAEDVKLFLVPEGADGTFKPGEIDQAADLLSSTDELRFEVEAGREYAVEITLKDFQTSPYTLTFDERAVVESGLESDTRVLAALEVPTDVRPQAKPIELSGNAGSETGTADYRGDRDVFQIVPPSDGVLFVSIDSADGRDELNASLDAFHLQDERGAAVAIPGTVVRRRQADGRTVTGLELQVVRDRIVYLRTSVLEPDTQTVAYRVDAELLPSGTDADVDPVTLDVGQSRNVSGTRISEVFDVDTIRVRSLSDGVLTVDMTPSTSLDAFVEVFEFENGQRRPDPLDVSNDVEGGTITIAINTLAGQDYEVRISSEDQASTGGYSTRLSLVAKAADDIGDTPVDATGIPSITTPSVTVSGVINDGADRDVFFFTAPATGRIDLDLRALDPNLDLFLRAAPLPVDGSVDNVRFDNPDLTDDNGERGFDAGLIFPVIKDRRYYVEASSRGGTTGRFELQVASGVPDEFGNGFNDAASLFLNPAGVSGRDRNSDGLIDGPSENARPVLGFLTQDDIDTFRFEATVSGQLLVTVDHLPVINGVQLPDDSQQPGAQALRRLVAQVSSSLTPLDPAGLETLLTAINPAELKLILDFIRVQAPSSVTDLLPVLDTGSVDVRTVVDSLSQVIAQLGYDLNDVLGFLQQFDLLSNDLRPLLFAYEESSDGVRSLIDFDRNNEPHLDASGLQVAGGPSSSVIIHVEKGRTYYLSTTSRAATSGYYQLQVRPNPSGDGQSLDKPIRLKLTGSGSGNAGGNGARPPRNVSTAVNGSIASAGGTVTYEFTPRADGRVVATVQGARSATSATGLFNPIVAIFDAAGRQLDLNNDATTGSVSARTGSPLAATDSKDVFEVSAHETYFVRVSGVGNDTGGFRLELAVNSFAPGEVDTGGNRNDAQQIVLTNGHGFAQDSLGTDDIDFYRFRSAQTGRATLSVTEPNDADDTMPLVRVLDTSGRQVAEGTGLITFNVFASAEYFVRISDDTGSYELSVDIAAGSSDRQRSGLRDDVGNDLSDLLAEQFVLLTAGKFASSSGTVSIEFQRISDRIIEEFQDGFGGAGSITQNFVLVYVDPVDFVLENSTGSQAGFTAQRGQIDEFGNTFYSGDAVTELLIIPQAQSGQYTLSLEGTGQNVAGGISLVSTSGVVQTQLFERNLLTGTDIVTINFADTGIPADDELVAEKDGVLFLPVPGFTALLAALLGTPQEAPVESGTRYRDLLHRIAIDLLLPERWKLLLSRLVEMLMADSSADGHGRSDGSADGGSVDDGSAAADEPGGGGSDAALLPVVAPHLNQLVEAMSRFGEVFETLLIPSEEPPRAAVDTLPDDSVPATETLPPRATESLPQSGPEPDARPNRTSENGQESSALEPHQPTGRSIAESV